MNYTYLATSETNLYVSITNEKYIQFFINEYMLFVIHNSHMH